MSACTIDGLELVEGHESIPTVELAGRTFGLEAIDVLHYADAMMLDHEWTVRRATEHVADRLGLTLAGALDVLAFWAMGG